MLSLLAALLLAESVPAKERIVIPVTADTSISCHPEERRLNAGGQPRLKLKGNENVILLGMDVAPLAGRRVLGALLHLKPTGPDRMLRWIGLSTVAAEWQEGVGGGGTQARDGESCFLFPGTGHGRRWAGDDSDLLDVIFGRGGTFWTRTTTRDEAAGWIAVFVDGALLEACAGGLSYGLAVSDDNGQTMRVSREVDPRSNLGNNYVFSREQHGAAPWLEVFVEPRAAAPTADRRPADLSVGVAPWTGEPSGAGGGVDVSFEATAATDAAEILGYRIRIQTGEPLLTPLPRWMHPAPGLPGERVRAHLRVLPGAAVTTEVEVIGRCGVVVARGLGAGFAAPVPAPPSRLSLPSLRSRPGDPPGAGAIRIWAVPDAVKVDPRTGEVLEDPAGAYGLANPVWSGQDRTVSLNALRGEWVAFQLVLAHAGETPVAWRITPGPLSGPGGASLPAGAVRLARVINVPDGAGGLVPDPLIPLAAGAPVTVPDPRHAVPGQTVQAVYAELFVPRELRPGRYTGRLAISPGSGEPVTLTLDLAVAAATLPEEAHFVWSLNGYNSPGYAYGRPGSAGFLAGERAAYVLAHEHRSTLAILHYSHSGNYEEGCVPAVAGAGSAMRVKEWAAWDGRFGPLFDGSAFAATSRPHAALDHFYLALSEHYPTAMAGGYRWNAVRWEDHWKVASPIEEGFSTAYREQWVAVARDYLAHVRAKGWPTVFQVYLNDKYFYKMYDAEKKSWGQGVSFWLLDEPMHPDDFLALRFFGRLLREATGGDRRHLIFRADVSAPAQSRDLLDRVLDLQVSGGLESSGRLLRDWRERFGQTLWTYGDSPGARDSDLMLSVTALDLYARGVDGYVPWLVLGTPDQWSRFATTSVLYDGSAEGLPGPCASLRLKAYRRAEQDVEYLRLHALRHHLDQGDPDRTRLAGMLAGALGTQKRMGKLDDQGAETAAYDRVDPARLESLRRALAAGL